MRGTLPYFKFGSFGTCTYCGDDAAEQADHVIAVSSQTLSKGHQKTLYGPITHACAHCNRTLSNHFFDTFFERCNYMANRLFNRGDGVEWSQEELASLEGPLLLYVEQKQAALRWFNLRASWFLSRNYLRNLENLLYIPYLDPQHPTFHEELYTYFKPTLVHVKANQVR